NLQVHATVGLLGHPGRVQQGGIAFAQGDNTRAARHGDAFAVGIDDSLPAHTPSPSTRITLTTSRTTSSAPMSLTVARSVASSAVWVTTTRLAVEYRSRCRTAAILTSCSANTCATRASTPGRSATSRLMWYRVGVSPIDRTGNAACADSRGP